MIPPYRLRKNKQIRYQLTAFATNAFMCTARQDPVRTCIPHVTFTLERRRAALVSPPTGKSEEKTEIRSALWHATLFKQPQLVGFKGGHSDIVKYSASRTRSPRAPYSCLSNPSQPSIASFHHVSRYIEQRILPGQILFIYQTYSPSIYNLANRLNQRAVQCLTKLCIRLAVEVRSAPAYLIQLISD